MNELTENTFSAPANPFRPANSTQTNSVEISVPHAGNPIAAQEQARAIAEVQAAMVVARMNPRDPIHAMDLILNECTRYSLAENATYFYQRGGTAITGPSIRLAEVIAQKWGNIQYGIRELSQKDGVSTALAYAWDVETNTRREVQFQVQLKRDTKKGSYALTEGRDIYEAVANFGARRLRSCILSLIPGDVVEAAVQQRQVTLKANVDMTKEGLNRVLVWFEHFGVTKSQIEKRIQCRFDSIRPAQVVSLGNILRSIREGASQVSDWFVPEEETKVTEENKGGNEGLKKVLRKKQQAAEPTQAPQEVPPEQVGEQEEADQTPETKAAQEATA